MADVRGRSAASGGMTKLDLTELKIEAPSAFTDRLLPPIIIPSFLAKKAKGGKLPPMTSSQSNMLNNDMDPFRNVHDMKDLFNFPTPDKGNMREPDWSRGILKEDNTYFLGQKKPIKVLPGPLTPGRRWLGWLNINISSPWTCFCCEQPEETPEEIIKRKTKATQKAEQKAKKLEAKKELAQSIFDLKNMTSRRFR